MTQPTDKQCTKCLAFKPMGEFGNDKSRKDGKRAVCRCCANAYHRKYYAANPEKANEYTRKYAAANPEKVKEDRRKYAAANPEKLIETARKYYAANAEKCKERSRKYYAANPKKAKEYARQYRAAARHARNQCAVINALDPKKWELLEAKLKTLNPLRK